MEIKKIILAGGSGFLGDIIIDHFRNSTTQIIVLTRGKERTEKNVRYINWDGKTLSGWINEIEASDALINLTGKSVDCRYTEKNKQEIIRSRVDATHILSEAVLHCTTPPKVWLNAASATIYRYSEDKDMTEESIELGTGFSVDVCKQWESTFNKINTPNTRKIILRITMVLGKKGGVIPVLKNLTRKGLGGTMGSGKQYISWIHEKDFLNVILHLINNANSSGVYNIAAPQPLTNQKFMQKMRRSLHVPFGLPAYSWMLEIGAFFMRTETELVLKSRKVISKRLQEEGYVFEYPSVDSALKELLQ